MTNLRVLVTNDGPHQARTWAELAADDIIKITAQAPSALMQQALNFRARLVEVLTRHHQHMIDDENAKIKRGCNALDSPFETEDHANKVAAEICTLAKGLSFESHFRQEHVRAHLFEVCNKYFSSAKLVQRQYFQSEKARAVKQTAKPKK